MLCILRKALQRFTSCVLQSGVELPYRAIKSHIADSIQLLIHIERRHEKRLVSQIVEIQGYVLETDKYDFKALFDAVTENEGLCIR